MLSIGKLGPGQADYYLNTVAAGIEDYYTGAGEAPGQWTATASTQLGLTGEVDPERLHRALAGQDPSSGRPLAHVPAGARRVPGFDLTFSAPKSVSVLFGLADPEVSAQVRDAHEAAVRAALGYMERHAAVARRGKGGTVAVPGDGFLAAAFRHRSSRAGGPQLHTHVLVANMTRGPDGRWTALDAKRLYAHAKTGGYLYQAHLRMELTRRLGVQWTDVHRGRAEVDGIPAPVLRAFSRRRTEIEAQLAQRGEHTAKAAQVAALDSRQAKDYTVKPQALQEGWWERARRLDLHPEELEAAVGRTEPAPLEREQVDATQEQLAGPTGLTFHRSSFTRRDAIQAWCDQLPQGAPVDTVERLADDLLDSDRTVLLVADTGGPRTADVIRRSDGRAIRSVGEERPYSTPELLALEQRIIDHATNLNTVKAGAVDPGTVDRALAQRPTLTAEQGEMIRRLCRDGTPVQVVVGKAGAGKTFALDAARDAWQRQGYVVVGAAVARRAARELQDGSGIPSTSTAALLGDLNDNGADRVLGERAVLVVDEAGMLGTRQLAQLLDHAAQVDAKVVLVGDPRQLPEIEAGGTFRGLAIRTQPIRLTANRRQSEQWERDALDQLRVGQAPEALRAYQAHGRVHLADTADEVRQQMTRDWWTRHQQEEGAGEVVMVAARRTDVADLNDRARRLMAADQRLGSETVEVQGREFAVGDHVVALRNHQRIGVLNGTRGQIADLDPDRRQLTIATSDGCEVTLPASYLDAATRRGGPTLDYGYAITGHKAQGMTTGAALVLGTDELYREWGYVALSRGRTENHLYLTGSDLNDRDEIAPNRHDHERDPLDAAVASLAHSRAQQMASDIAHSGDLARLSTPQLASQVDQLRSDLTAAASVSPAQRQLAALAEQRAQAELALATAREQIATLHQQGAKDRDPRLRRHQAIAVQATRRLQALDDRERELQIPARPPAPPHGPAGRERDLVRYATLRDELTRRQALAIRAITADPPAYLTSTLGPVPEQLSRRRIWQHAADRMERYRQHYRIGDDRRPLGAQPDELAQRAAWHETQRFIAHAQRDLAARRLPERERGVAH